jgi:hypothetical protein
MLAQKPPSSLTRQTGSLTDGFRPLKDKDVLFRLARVKRVWRGSVTAPSFGKWWLLDKTQATAALRRDNGHLGGRWRPVIERVQCANPKYQR